MYDKHHTLFQFKYINNSLQIIKRAFYLLPVFKLKQEDIHLFLQ
jgi:hypothetical protein